MLYIFIAVLSAILVVAFFMCVGAYCLGLKHGKQFTSGVIPKLNLNPIKAVAEALEQHEQKQEEKKVEEELDDILNCSAESMLKAIKLEKSK